MELILKKILTALLTSKQGRNLLLISVLLPIMLLILVVIIIPMAILTTTPMVDASEIESIYTPVTDEIEKETRTLKNGEPYGDKGVRINPIYLIAIDTVLLKQDFSKVKKEDSKKMGMRFIKKEIVIEKEYIPKTCTKTVGIGGTDSTIEYDCGYWIVIEWTYFHEKSISDVLDELVNEDVLKKEEIEDILTIIDFSMESFYTKIDHEPSVIGTNDWFWPTASTRITSPQGYRWSPCSGCSNYHQGVDIGATNPGVPGDQVWAMEEGKVSYAGWANGYGQVVYIDHSEGYQTRYAHLHHINVKKGQQIDKGAILGIMGSTGAGTGVHLHFEIRENKQAIDPMIYFK